MTWPRRTVRLRLTAWYGGLFLVSAVALIAVTYGLVVQAFTGNSAGNVLCRAAGAGCHAIGARAARAIAVQDHSVVLGELVSRSALALAVVAVLSVGVGWFMAGRALRPIRIMSATARQISATSLSERLALPGPPDELTDLADTFDDLLARLEAAFSAQRQFIANAAHELRTPLARQRVISQVALADPGSSEETLRSAHERVLASGAQQHQLIDALLLLARSQAGLDVTEPFDLASLTCGVLATRHPELTSRDLSVRTSLGPSGTTWPAAASTSAPGAETTELSCRCPTPGRSCRRPSSTGSSSHSSGSTLTAPAVVTDSGWAWRSCRPSQPPTTQPSPDGPGPAAAW
jgi:signal transduction histidine kinase